MDNEKRIFPTVSNTELKEFELKLLLLGFVPATKDGNWVFRVTSKYHRVFIQPRSGCLVLRENSNTNLGAEFIICEKPSVEAFNKVIKYLSEVDDA